MLRPTGFVVAGREVRDVAPRSGGPTGPPRW
jgi:hypothetical protein